jgi:hypothetical protein
VVSTTIGGSAASFGATAIAAALGSAAMGLLFKPFGLVAGLIASRLSSTIFDRVWRSTEGQPLPDPDVREDPAGRAIAAAALQAGIFAATSAAANRYGMHVFEHLFGRWPGKSRADEDARAEKKAAKKAKKGK